jgi:hypothetical protein
MRGFEEGGDGEDGAKKHAGGMFFSSGENPMISVHILTDVDGDHVRRMNDQRQCMAGGLSFGFMRGFEEGGAALDEIALILPSLPDSIENDAEADYNKTDSIPGTARSPEEHTYII